jgi:fibronectin type 3 domain-containing protein
VAFKQNSAPSAASSTVTGSPVAPPLATPSGLVATAGNAQVSLSWTAVSGATSYRVYRGLSGGALTLLSSPSGTSYVDSTAVNGQAYDYTVAAVGPSSTSAQSGKVTATPSAPVSGVPTGLSAQAGDTTVTLRWSAVSGATSYKVYRVGTATAIATTALLTYTDTALTNNTAYTYYVTAINGTESAASTQVTATPFVLTPSVPAGVLATAGDKQVVLSWTASTNAQSYKLYRDGALIASPTGTTATDTGLVNGVAHAYTVAAVNGSATSATSTPVSATPMAPAPAAPTGLVATAGDTTVALSWTAVANATSYHVYRGATLVGSPTGTTYTDTALVNNTLYSYTVKAVRDTTESPASTAVSATPKKPVIDGTYTGATAAIASGHGTINVVIVVTGGKITAASGNLLTFDGSETKGINTGNTVITGGALAAYATKTVAAQSTAITKVSGATLTFNAWKTSLQSALTQAGL